MVQNKKKLGKSEMSLIKEYCGRLSDENLQVIFDLLPQKVAGDRASACLLLQEDKEIDKWLSQAISADDWFSRVDGIGEVAATEIETRSKKKQ